MFGIVQLAMSTCNLKCANARGLRVLFCASLMSLLMFAGLRSQTIVHDRYLQFTLPDSRVIPINFHDIDNNLYDYRSLDVIGSSPFQQFPYIVQTRITEYGEIDPLFLFKSYQFTDPRFMQSILPQVENVDKRLCNGLSSTMQYLSGTNNCSEVVSSTLFGNLRVNPDQTTGLVLFEPANKNIVNSWVYDTQNPQTWVYKYCAHNLRSDPVGRRFSTGSFSTSHSYLAVGNGVRYNPDDPPNESLKAGVLMGETTRPPTPTPLAPRAYSYNIIEVPPNGPQITRATIFYDVAIDNGRVEAQNPERDQLLVCNNWLAMVVGKKEIIRTSTTPEYGWGLISDINENFLPLRTDVFEFFEPAPNGRRLITKFDRIIPTYSSSGAKTGHLVAGSCYYDMTIPGNPSFAVFLMFNGCGHQNNVWYTAVSFAGISIYNVQALVEVGSDQYVAVVNTSDNGTPRYVMIDGGNSSKIVSVWKDKGSNWSITSDIAAKKPLYSFSQAVYTVGDFVQNAGAGPRLSWIQPNIKLESSEDGCGVLPVEFAEHQLVMSMTNRTMYEHAEFVLPTQVAPLVMNPSQTVCSSVLPSCTGDGNDGLVEVWGSHYDRGNALAYFNGGEIVSTGMCAGPYFSNVTEDNSCFVCDGVKTTQPSIFNMDIDLTYTDGNFAHSNATNHGWFRLLTDKEDIPIQCQIGQLPEIEVPPIQFTVCLAMFAV